MRTFSENLQINKNIFIFEVFLTSIYNHGLDPVKFVDWMAFGEDFSLNESSLGDWWKSQNKVDFKNMADGGRKVGGAIGSAVGNTVGGTTDFAGNLVGGTLSGLGGLTQGLAGGAIGSAASGVKKGAQNLGSGAYYGLGVDKISKFANNTFGSPGTPAPGAPGTPAPGTPAPGAPAPVQQALANLNTYSKNTSGRVSKIVGDPNFGAAITKLIHMLGDPNQISSAPSAPSKFENVISKENKGVNNHYTNFVERRLLANKVIFEFHRRGIDAIPFIEWYGTEGFKLNENQFSEGLWDRFTGWLGQKTGWTQANNKRDLQATQYLIQTLQQLDKQGVGSAELKQQLSSVLQSLQNVIPTLSNAEQQQPQQGDQPATTEEQPTEENPPEASPEIKPNMIE